MKIDVVLSEINKAIEEVNPGGKESKEIRVLKETIEYYYKNPRSITRKNRDSFCLYAGKQNRRCAVGRLMTPEMLNVICKSNQNEGSIYAIERYRHSSGLEKLEMLKKEYSGLSLEFLSHLQLLHDTDSFWQKKQRSLTRKGMHEAILIVRTFEKKQLSHRGKENLCYLAISHR